MTKEDFKKIESALIERILKEIKTETELPALMAALHTLNVVKDYPQNYQG